MGMAATMRSSGRRPMLAARAASSARRAASDAATPRGAPVEPEVTFTKAASLAALPAATASSTRLKRQASASAGQPVRDDSIHAAPRPAHARRRSAVGAKGSSSTTPCAVARKASTPARNAGPFGADRPTSPSA